MYTFKINDLACLYIRVNVQFCTLKTGKFMLYFLVIRKLMILTFY
jgi:hypothetical protein